MIEDKSKCFILTKDGEYEEITYEELKKRREVFESYKYKKFLPLHGMLMEVGDYDYHNFYKEFNRYRYYEKLQSYINVLSVDEILLNGKDIFTDSTEDLALEITKREELEKLYFALLKLSPEEYELIKSLFWEGKTIREYSQTSGIPKSSVENKKMRIIKKLEKYLKFL